MVKKVTDDDLDELRRMGSVNWDPETREIARFGELIGKLEELITVTSKRTAADFERSQVQLEVLATLQKMIRANGTKSQVSHETIDMEPLKAILVEIQESNAARERTAYQFNIQRGEGGYMAGVTATPISPTTH